MTKLAAKLPKGEADGLAALSRELIDNPQNVHVVVALVDCQRVTTDTDTGDVEPTARIRRIEWIQDDREVVGKILRRAMEKRTGKAVLPLDLEEDMRAVFDGINPDTGEIR